MAKPVASSQPAQSIPPNQPAQSSIAVPATQLNPTSTDAVAAGKPQYVRPKPKVRVVVLMDDTASGVDVDANGFPFHPQTYSKDISYTIGKKLADQFVLDGVAKIV